MNVIHTRVDRYGSNAVPFLVNVFKSRLESYPLFHDCSGNCKKLGLDRMIMHQFLVSNTLHTSKASPGTVLEPITNKIWSPRITCKDLFNKYNKTFPELFYEKGNTLECPECSKKMLVFTSTDEHETLYAICKNKKCGCGYSPGYSLLAQGICFGRKCCCGCSARGRATSALQ